jgi:hypothetical protein
MIKRGSLVGADRRRSESRATNQGLRLDVVLTCSFCKSEEPLRHAESSGGGSGSLPLPRE